MGAEAAVSTTARKDIETIAQLEQQFLRQRSPAERISESITRFFGSLYFVLAHVAWFALWVVCNIGLLPGLQPFDPYPFSFLGLVVALEAILLTTFVLISQNLQMRRAEQWSQLNLHVSLLAERETTKVLEMQQSICHFLGLRAARDAEVKELTQRTEVVALVEEMEKTRQVGEVVVEEIERVRETEMELTAEMKKTRAAGTELVEELEKMRAVETELVEAVGGECKE